MLDEKRIERALRFEWHEVGVHPALDEKRIESVLQLDVLVLLQLQWLDEKRIERFGIDVFLH